MMISRRMRILAILFIGMTPAVNAMEQGDLDALYQRLAELEAEQARSKATIETLRSQVEVLEEKAGAVYTVAVEDLDDVQIAKKSEVPVSDLTRGTAFADLADESRFLTRSHDGQFELGIDGLMATRWEYNYRSDDGTGSSRDDQGWETVGTRINFKGFVYGDYGYWVRLQADEFSSDPFVDALIGYYKLNESTTIVAGQFPSILNRENGLPLDKLVATESTAANYAFDPLGFKGVMVGYHTPKVIYRGIVHDGYRSVSNSAFSESSADWALAGQVIGMLAGDENDWARFNNMTSRPGEDYAWQLNGSFNVQEGTEHGDSEDGGSDDIVLGMLESSMEGDGWHLYGSGYYRETKGPSTNEIEYTDLGFVLQGGAWVARHLELYSRYDIVVSDDDRPVENKDFSTLSVGLNIYPHPHTDNIKFGTEVLYMFDPEAESIVTPNTFNSIQASPDGGQWVVRTQAHLRW